MKSADVNQPVRETEIPKSPDIAVNALLDARDVDRLAALCHALIEEVADLSVRVSRLEAAETGDAPADDLAAVQTQSAALVARVLG